MDLQNKTDVLRHLAPPSKNRLFAYSIDLLVVLYPLIHYRHIGTKKCEYPFSDFFLSASIIFALIVIEGTARRMMADYSTTPPSLPTSPMLYYSYVSLLFFRGLLNVAATILSILGAFWFVSAKHAKTNSVCESLREYGYSLYYWVFIFIIVMSVVSCCMCCFFSGIALGKSPSEDKINKNKEPYTALP